jgi:hypothetical protein
MFRRQIVVPFIVNSFQKIRKQSTSCKSCNDCIKNNEPKICLPKGVTINKSILNPINNPTVLTNTFYKPTQDILNSPYFAHVYTKKTRIGAILELYITKK